MLWSMAMLVAAAAPAADAPRRARPSLPPPAFISIAVQMPPKVTLAPSVPGRAMTEYGTLGAPQQAAPRHEGHGGRPLPGSAAGTAHRPFFSPMMSGMGGSSGLGYGANPDAMLAMMRPMMSMYGGKKQHTDVDPNVIPAVRAPAAAQLATPGRRLPRGDWRLARGTASVPHPVARAAQVQKMLQLSVPKGDKASDLVHGRGARRAPERPRSPQQPLLRPRPCEPARPCVAGQGGNVRRGDRRHGRRARAARTHAQEASGLRAGVAALGGRGARELEECLPSAQPARSTHVRCHAARAGPHDGWQRGDCREEPVQDEGLSGGASGLP
jgi:hypothetical protein